MRIKYLFIIFTFLLSQFALAQKGTISGIAHDESLNDVLPFASVTIKGTTTGASTDFEGKYSFKADPGTYTLVFSFVGYTVVEISDVVVKPSKETVVEAYLKENSSTLDEVVVTATVRKNTEKSLIKLQKNAAVVVDGLSVQSIVNSGATNVALAIKQIPGVSIEGGKFVVVRGLSDRYSKTLLNGLDVPGLDPDKNSLQVDLFPTNILENLVVSKTASADLPADFTGGVVDITLKDFANQPEYKISASIGYNPQQHFNNNFQSIDKGNLGFLGFSNNRGLVLDRDFVTPNPIDAARVQEARELTQRFSPELRAPTTTNFADVSLGFTASNSYNLANDNKIGYQANISYKSSTDFFSNALDGTFTIDPQQTDSNQFVANNFGGGPLSVHETLLTGLGGISYKTLKSKYKVTGLFIRNGESNSSIRDQTIEQIGGGGFFRIVDENTYTERTISNFLLAGEHSLGNWKIDWKLSPTFSKVHDLDHRITPLTIQLNNAGEDTVTIDAASGSPFRIWRFLDEVNYTGKFDIERKFGKADGISGKFKTGAYITFKERDFSIGQYRFDGSGTFDFDDANPNDLFLPENIIGSNNPDSFRFTLFGSQNFRPVEAFNAEQNTIAGYIQNETKFSENFRINIGVRIENFKTIYSGVNSFDFSVIDNEELINNTNLFPSVNLVFEVNENSNLRASYSKSTARPSFREASANDIFDPVTGRRFIGALGFKDTNDSDNDGDTEELLKLRQTFIDNIDLRYEFFSEDNNDGFAISAFYKKFEDAIELVFPVTAATISPRNLDNAFLYGAEFEFRKNLGFIGLEKISAKFNASYVESQVDIIDGQQISGSNETTRTLQGQAPYNINAVLEYRGDDSLVINLNYNVQGETLETVGSQFVPNVFTQPFDRLNLSVSKSFGNHGLKLKATNLLGDVTESLFKADGIEDGIFTRRVPNQAISLGYSYKF